MLIYFFEKRSFDVKSFNDHFNDPVCFFYCWEIILKISGRNPLDKIFVIKRCRFLFDGQGKSLLGNMISTFAFLLCR